MTSPTLPSITSHLGPFSNSSAAFESGTGPPNHLERFILHNPRLEFSSSSGGQHPMEVTDTLCKSAFGDRNLSNNHDLGVGSKCETTPRWSISDRAVSPSSRPACAVPTRRKLAMGFPPLWGSAFWASPQCCAKISIGYLVVLT